MEQMSRNEDPGTSLQRNSDAIIRIQLRLSLRPWTENESWEEDVI